MIPQAQKEGLKRSLTTAGVSETRTSHQASISYQASVVGLPTCCYLFAFPPCCVYPHCLRCTNPN